MRYLLCIKYNGTKYYGWAKQPGLPTIQNVLESSLKKFFKKKISTTVASRTDKGVHANIQYVHFDVESKYELNERNFVSSINKILPVDILVKSCQLVSKEFNVRFNTLKKTYLYLLNVGKINPFMSHQIYQYGKSINLDLIRKSLQLFIGKHDFASFTTEEYKNNIREIFQIDVCKVDDIVAIMITGDSFLKYMVRMIVGNVLSLSEKKITSQWIVDKLNKPSKGLAKYVAPPNGLYLYNIFFK